jgi:hypothetical protein
MSTDQSPELEKTLPLNTRLAILATPVFEGRLEIEFDRNNFFNRTSFDPKKPDKTLRIDTSPANLFQQVLKSIGEPINPELQALIDERSQQYTDLIVTGRQAEITEMIAATIPLNAAINQAFVALDEFLDQKYDRMFETTAGMGAHFGKFVIAQCVIQDRQ